MMKYEDHQNDIASDRHKSLSDDDLRKRIQDLSQIGGSNPGQINQANQIVTEYRRELDARQNAKHYCWTVVAAIAAVLSVLIGIASILIAKNVL
ncbi:MAG: hypothetical protein R3C01_13125 [Planctomycetaceae bacterium]